MSVRRVSAARRAGIVLRRIARRPGTRRIALPPDSGGALVRVGFRPWREARIKTETAEKGEAPGRAEPERPLPFADNAVSAKPSHVSAREKRRKTRTRERRKPLTLAALKRFAQVRLAELCREYGMQYEKKTTTCPLLLEKMKEADAAWV